MSTHEFTTQQAARICGISRIAVFRMIQNKKMHAVKRGKNYSIPMQEIVLYLIDRHLKLERTLIRGIATNLMKCYESELRQLVQYSSLALDAQILYNRATVLPRSRFNPNR